MNELIKVKERDGIENVNARDLHEFIESRQEFSNWIKSRIEKYGFKEKEDFTIDKFINGKATQKDYYISIDMAKELSMVENNEKGREARRYFIEIEKNMKNISYSVKEEEIKDSISINTLELSAYITFNDRLDVNAVFSIISSLPKNKKNDTKKDKGTDQLDLFKTEIESRNPAIKEFFNRLSYSIKNNPIERTKAFDLYKSWCLSRKSGYLGKKNFYIELRKIESITEIKKNGQNYFIIL